ADAAAGLSAAHSYCVGLITPASLAGCVVPLQGSYTAFGTRCVSTAHGTKTCTVFVPRASLLPSLVTWGSALCVGAWPFTRILGLANDPTQRAAKTQGLLQRRIQGALGYLFRRPDGQRRMTRDALGEVTGSGQQLVCRHDPTHQPHPQRRSRIDGIA